MYTAGMRSCAIAVHFRPRGFALPLLVALPFGLPHPPTSLSMVGLRCSGKYTYSPLRISVLAKHPHLRGVHMDGDGEKAQLPVHLILGANDFIKIHTGE